MTLAQLFANADSRELGLWIALHQQEAREHNLANLANKAAAARRSR